MTDLTGFKHGVNLGGWFSQCNHTKERYDNFIKEEDFKIIKEWGLDHVRIPVDYNLVETEKGEYKEEGFAYIQTAIDWCKKYGLNMILDLHKTAGFSFDIGEKEVGLFSNEKLQERFCKLWEQFAKRFAQNKDMLCFELLNEITDQSFSQPWNALTKKCIERIRKIDSTIRILVGSYWNNALSAVKDLDEPFDENIIYNFHCYEPLIFTHQGAGWFPVMDKSFRMDLKSNFSVYSQNTLKYMPGVVSAFDSLGKDNTVSAEYFEKLMEEAIKVAKERNVSLYCGEYGVIDMAKPEDALEWYKMITSVLDKYDIGRAAWSYRSMNFGISDSWLDSVREKLIKVM